MPLLLRPPFESAPALIDGGETWSHARLADEVDRVARALGAGGQLGFLWCRNDRATVVAYLAALRARHAVALFDAELDPAHAAALVADYRPDWQLGRDDAGGADDYRLAGAADLPALRVRRQLDPVRPHADLAVLLSTSGTTGSRKLVRLSAGAVVHNARAIAEALAIDPAQRAPTALPLHYSYGLSVVASHLIAGASIVVTADGLVADGFWRAVRDHRCTSIAATPHGCQILRRLDLDRLDVPAVTTVTQAGGRLEPAVVTHLAEQMRRRGGRFHVMYGQTEATARIAVMPADAVIAHPDAVGLPLRDGRIAIDAGEREAAPGEIGEIVYRGPNVMMGYATGRSDLARGDDQRGELRTGDLGFVDAGGYLHVTGRTRRIAKIHGLRLNLDEVEALAQVDGPVAVVDGPDRLIVFYEGAPDAALAERRRDLAAKLRIHVSTIAVHGIAALPRTASGKIDYPSLAGRAGAT